MAIENGVILEGSPIGGEIFTFFGIGPHSDGKYWWGDIPQSSLINPKSKLKPVNFLSEATQTDAYGRVYGRRTRLTDNMRRSVNYGHTFVEYTNALDAIRGVAGGTNFPYDRPGSWFRPADLWGYNHNAGNWHNVTTSVTSVGQGSPVTVDISNIDEIFTYGKLSGLNIYNVNFGFLMWNSAFSVTQPQVYFLSLTNMANAEQQLGSLMAAGKLSFSTTNIPQGTWRMYPCVTTASFTKNSFNYIKDTTSNGRWFPYPFCNTHIIEVVAAGGGEENVIDSIGVYENYEMFFVDPSNLTFSISHLGIYAYNDSSAGYTVSIQARIENAVYNQQTFNGSVYVASGQEGYIPLIDAKSEEYYYRFTVADTPPRLWVRYYITKDGKTQESQTTIDLDKY